MDLSNQSAIVTGGASGLGHATARRLADAGAAVVVVDLPDREGETVRADAVAALGPRARFVTGDVTAEDGRGVVVEGHEDGFYVGATLFDRVTADMSIYREEIFGPVLSVVRAKDYEEALTLVNEHEFGNGVAIFTRDGDAARDFSTRVDTGMVGVNVPIPVPIAYYTFGGWKASGFGDLNQHGTDGLKFYTKTKTVTTRWPSGVREGASFVMPAGS